MLLLPFIFHSTTCCKCPRTREKDVVDLVAQQQVYECECCDHYNLQNLVENPNHGYEKLRANAFPYAVHGQRPSNMGSSASLKHPIFRAAKNSTHRNADTSPGKRLGTVLEAVPEIVEENAHLRRGCTGMSQRPNSPTPTLSLSTTFATTTVAPFNFICIYIRLTHCSLVLVLAVTKEKENIENYWPPRSPRHLPLSSFHHLVPIMMLIVCAARRRPLRVQVLVVQLLQHQLNILLSGSGTKRANM